MNFFNRNKLSIRQESVDGYIKHYLDYSKIKKSDVFKTTFLNRIINSASCLVIVDTSLFLSQSKEDIDVSIDELLLVLSKNNIEFKKISTKAANNLSVFGVALNVKERTENKDHIIGFVISKDQIELAQSLLSNFNTFYYINYLGDNSDLLTEVQHYYEEKDEFYTRFAFSIFDFKFMQSITVYSESGNEKFVTDAIDVNYLK